MDEKVRTMNGARRPDADSVHQRDGMVNGYHEKVANDTSPDKVLIEKNVEGLRERMQEIKEDVLELLQRLEGARPEKMKEHFQNSNRYCDKRKSSKEGVLFDKQFLERNSLLTDLYEVTHIRTIYNIFLVTLILLLLNTVLHDIMNTGTTNVGIRTVATNFDKFSTVIEIWLLMFGSTLGVYMAFDHWAQQRLKLLPKSLMLKMWDYGCLTVLILYQIMLITLPAKMVLQEELPIASSVAVLMEQVRMMMKVHAFVRSSAPRFLSYKPHTESKKPTTPGFSQFLYFMFAPTLIYRDSYPRTKEIRWKVVVWNYTEVLMTIFYIAFLFERFICPTMIHSIKFPLELRSTMIYTFNIVLPSTVFLLCGFYCVLHSWMNGSAELMRFADRLFYKDWWNSTSYASYYRTWNVVVHDWLYTYIYKDMYEIVTPGNKLLSTCAVFSASALFHEYIIAFSFRFFYPVMLLMFGGLGFALVFLTHHASGNVFMWLTLCLGNAMLMSLYTIEYYARTQCDAYYDWLFDLFVPRSWSCIGSKTS